jgi:hypothetical protein
MAGIEIRSKAEWKRGLFVTFLLSFSLLALVGNVVIDLA